jgi:hypothetical protein
MQATDFVKKLNTAKKHVLYYLKINKCTPIKINIEKGGPGRI